MNLQISREQFDAWSDDEKYQAFVAVCDGFNGMKTQAEAGAAGFDKVIAKLHELDIKTRR